MLFPVCFKGFLDVADNMIRRKKLVQNKLDTVLSEAENSLQAARFFMRSDLESERNKAAEHAANALRLALGAARNACVKLYKISSDLPENTSESVENFSAGEASTGLFALENEVKIAFLPRAVLLQMPLLWTKDSANRQPHIFAHTIITKLSKSNIYDVINVKDFAYKTIQSLRVYNADPKQICFQIDNDNRLTKSVQDAVAVHFLGSDSALQSSLHASSIVTDRVLERTYMLVLAEKNQPWPEEKILDFWTQNHSEMC